MSNHQSCEGHYSPEPVDLWGVHPKGTFFYSKQQDQGVTYRVIWVNMPYNAAPYEGQSEIQNTWHGLPIIAFEWEWKTIGVGELAEKVRSFSNKMLEMEVVPPRRPFWKWDGNKEKPTLSPSIRCGGSEDNLWHGYLLHGYLKVD